MTDLSSRLALPFIVAGQSQKEVTHNEALVLADLLIQSVVVDVAPAMIPATPALGQCWIIGAGAAGPWLGRDGYLACWTEAGWRFSAPFAGMEVHNLATGLTVRRTGSNWVQGNVTATSISIAGNQVVAARQAAIANPASGSTVDSEARLAVVSILTALRTHGLIAT